MQSDNAFHRLALRIASCQAIWTQTWHSGEANRPSDAFLTLVQEQARSNFDLWHAEDQARAPDATDAQIAAVKRTIDKLNQLRNDLIEKIDDSLLSQLEAQGVKAGADAPWNTETPGSVIDRLSILSLKVHHMREQTERQDAAPEHLQKCRARLEILLQQRENLVIALQVLLDNLMAGRKQMKLYRQFKMYNDPDANPAIYGSRASKKPAP